ncbi:MAG: hypothetical protein JWN54_3553 [Mycobacterium sp.]|nr:hypothetical protein [Mycobacterium sp.]
MASEFTRCPAAQVAAIGPVPAALRCDSGPVAGPLSPDTKTSRRATDHPPSRRPARRDARRRGRPDGASRRCPTGPARGTGKLRRQQGVEPLSARPPTQAGVPVEELLEEAPLTGAEREHAVTVARLGELLVRRPRERLDAAPGERDRPRVRLPLFGEDAPSLEGSASCPRPTPRSSGYRDAKTPTRTGVLRGVFPGAGAGFEPATSGYEQSFKRPSRSATSPHPRPDMVGRRVAVSPGLPRVQADRRVLVTDLVTATGLHRLSEGSSAFCWNTAQCSSRRRAFSPPAARDTWPTTVYPAFLLVNASGIHRIHRIQRPSVLHLRMGYRCGRPVLSVPCPYRTACVTSRAQVYLRRSRLRTNSLPSNAVCHRFRPGIRSRLQSVQPAVSIFRRPVPAAISSAGSKSVS